MRYVEKSVSELVALLATLDAIDDYDDVRQERGKDDERGCGGDG